MKKVLNSSLLRRMCRDIDDMLFTLNSDNCDDKLSVEYDIFYLLEYAFTTSYKSLLESEIVAEENEVATNYVDEEKKLSSRCHSAFKRYLNEMEYTDYTFEQYNDTGYRIILPPLLSRYCAKKSKTYSVKSKYIAFVFEQLVKNNNEIIERINEATIIIISHQLAEGSVIMDNDNVDAHDVINLINKYLMNTDDNGTRISVMYDTVLSDSPKTEIYIIPKLKIGFLLDNCK